MSLDITPEVAPGRSLIEAYGDGGFRLAGARREGSQIIFPERAVDWPVTDVTGITLDSLGAVVEAASGIQILVVGCGPNFTDEPDGLRRGLRDHGIVMEWMDSAAACRTFNVLLTEDRDVAAALIAVD